MLLSIISAMNHQNVIGMNNQLPWHLPADLKRFKHITSGNSILMGRNTFESIGKALPNRHNIVVTRQANYAATDCDVVNSLQQGIKAVTSNEAFIIGGSQLYVQSLPFVQKMYLTIIHHDFVGDCYFPQWDKTEWLVVEQHDFQPDEKNHYTYSFITYVRNENQLR